MVFDDAAGGVYSGPNQGNVHQMAREAVTVIIPTLNEAEGIGEVIDEVRGCGYERIIVVDGGSTDGTDKIAREKGVMVIPQEGRGKADAIRTGIKYAKSEYVAIMDGDYTYPAHHLDDLYKKILEGYDEVIGARMKGDGLSNVVFKFGNALLTKFFNLLFGTRLRDVLSGMYMVRMDALREVLFEMKRFSVESEIAVHIASTTQGITDIPIEYRRRRGKKKLRVRHGLFIAWDMVRLAWRYNLSLIHI